MANFSALRKRDSPVGVISMMELRRSFRIVFFLISPCLLSRLISELLLFALVEIRRANLTWFKPLFSFKHRKTVY